MTAKTSQKLADALRHAGLETLAKRAEQDEFHDFLSPHDMPTVTLANELVAIIHGKVPGTMQDAARTVRNRLINGDFDASTEESDEWAASPEGQATIRRLIE